MGRGAGLLWRETAGLRWLQWRCAGVSAAFPTREGGASSAPFDSLDISLTVGDAGADVLENRRRLCAALGLELGRLVVPGQVHGTTVPGWATPRPAEARSRPRR